MISFKHTLCTTPLPELIKYELEDLTRLRITGRGAELIVQPGDSVGGDKVRAELKIKDTGGENETWWYAYSFFIPNTFVAGNGHAIIGQLHDGKPASGTWPGRPPLLALRYYAQGYDFVYGTKEKRHVSASTPLQKATWVRIMWRVFWSQTTAGSADVFVNGKPSVSFKSPNLYGPEKSYFKFGIYEPDGIVKTTSVILKEVAVGPTREYVETVTKEEQSK